MKMWLTYWNDTDTGKFRQQQSHSEAAASAIGAAVLKSGQAAGGQVHIEFAQPYRIAR